MLLWFESLTWEEIAAGLAGALLVLTVLEKLVGVDLVGRRVFRAIWAVLAFFARRIVGPELEKVESFLASPHRIETKVGELKHEAAERDLQRSKEFHLLAAELEVVKQENRFTDGQLVRDAVEKLVRHDDEKWHLLSRANNSLSLINLRLDNMDAREGILNFELDENLACTYISPRFLRFFGYVEHDIIGNDWEFCIGARSIDTVKFKWARARDKHTEYQNEQYIVDSDGREYLCRVRGYPRVSTDGEFQGFYGTVELAEEAAAAEPLQ